MANSLAGLLTGIDPSGIDPQANLQQQQLALGAGAAKMMQSGMRGLAGQEDTASQLQSKLTQQMANFQNLSEEEQRRLIGVLQATGQTALAGQLASTLQEKYTKGSTFTVQDENENNFIAIPTVNTGTGEMEIQYQAIGGGPEQPEGKTVMTGGEFGMTAVEEAQRVAGQKGGETVAKEFSKAKVEAVSKLPEINDNINTLKNSLELLKTIPTGGPVNLAKYGIQEFFGLTGGDKATLERQMALSILQSLKPIFGGLISEGERKALVDIGANVKRGNKANMAIIESMIERLENTRNNAMLYTTAENQEEYETLIKGMFEQEEEEPKISWDSLIGVK